MTDETRRDGATPEGDAEHRILDAARRVFVRRGTAGARMQEIAGEAGVNQALLHYYYRTKDRLAQAVFRLVAGRVAPGIAGLLGSDESIETKVERFVHLYIDAVREHPFIPGYILSEMHHHPERLSTLVTAVGIQPEKVVGAVLDKLRAQIAEGVAAGTMRPIAPQQLLVNMLSLSVFPFAARPALTMALGLDDTGFARFLDERRAELPGFILRALRP